MEALAYTVAQGERGGNAEASLPAPGTARWSLTAPLAPGEGLTIVLSFPKGLVTAPSQAQRVRWFLQDNSGVLVPLIGLLLVAGFCLQRWHRVGRDPRGGVAIARYLAPEGHSTGGLPYMPTMRAETHGCCAQVPAIGVDVPLRRR